MKRLNWAGRVVTSLLTVTALAGCSDDPASPNPGGGGSGNTGGGGAGTGGATGKPATMLSGAAAYTVLSGPNATPATTPAPTPYTTTGACIACHGNNGEGIDNLAPEIRHTPLTYASWVVRNGRSGTSMSPFPVTSLSEADLTTVVTWLDSMPKPTTPEGLYKDFCGNCHGPGAATGGAVAVNITGLSSALVSTYVRTGSGTDPMLRTGYMPKFETTLLTEAELAQIQTFIGSITP
jgi:mono/diheme cytochrome c family protein